MSTARRRKHSVPPDTHRITRYEHADLEERAEYQRELSGAIDRMRALRDALPKRTRRQERKGEQAA